MDSEVSLRMSEALPKITTQTTQGGSRPSGGGGGEDNPLKSCLSVSRVESALLGGVDVS